MFHKYITQIVNSKYLNLLGYPSAGVNVVPSRLLKNKSPQIFHSKSIIQNSNSINITKFKTTVQSLQIHREYTFKYSKNH